jgi:hypothetical protein
MNQKRNIYFYNIESADKFSLSFWEKARSAINSSGGKFVLDMSRKEAYRWINRSQGEWTDPWPITVLGKYKMPKYDSNFRKSFTEIMDCRAQDVIKEIRDKDTIFILSWSGGIDSTLTLVALLKHMQKGDLKNLRVYCDTSSFIENPYFYKNHIENKIKTIDGSTCLLEDVISEKVKLISTYQTECLTGSVAWLNLQINFYSYLKDLSETSKRHISSIWKKATTADVHFSQFKDLIISFYSLQDNKDLGVLWYDKMLKNIKSCNVPVHSLYDYFWWNVFNIKLIPTSVKILFKDNTKIINENNIFSWYLTKDYQKWSMVNNNNGEKIDFYANSHKIAYKKYIFEFDKNRWYLNLKHRICSADQLRSRDKSMWKGYLSSDSKFAIDDKFQNMYLTDKQTQDFIIEHLNSYEVDW